MGSIGGGNRPHAIIVPYPFQGHIIPAVHLALKLASRGFAVTFVNTEAVDDKITRSAAAAGGGASVLAVGRAAGLDIRYEVVSDGLPVGFDRSMRHDEFQGSLMVNMPAEAEAAVGRVVAAASPPVTCLVADTFFVWPERVARKMGVAHVSFWTEPALVFTLYYHLDLLRKNGHFGSEDNRKDAIDYVPGVPAIEPSDLMSYLQGTETNSIVHQIIYRAFDSAKGADAIICNTVEELELETVSAFRAIKPFYAVGPIFPPNFAKSPVAMSLWTEADCTQWLDSRPLGSVIYVSFGSYAHIDKRDLQEIAMGIMDSGVAFVWVLRPDVVSSDDPDPLPAEFLEKTKERGVVVPWCCQVEVLRHKATGGFLTHCGWNSVLESVWAGVPMLCFPLLTDQFTNRKLVVKDWRVGVDLAGGGGSGSGSVAREGVRTRVKEVMEGEAGAAMREEVKTVRRKLVGALEMKGSSERNFDAFVKDMGGRVRE